MQKDIIEKEIAEIIKDFRQSSVGIEINQAHVHKWVSQFNPDVQDTILEETLHILKKWYFGRDKISLFLNEIMNYLKLENKNATDADPFKGICFLDIQESGKSQIQLIEILKDEANKKYGCSIRTGNPGQENYYVYLDDGLYTGSRLRKDIKRCLQTIPEGSHIDVIYLIACRSGMDFSKSVLEKVCKTIFIDGERYVITKQLRELTMLLHTNQFRNVCGLHQGWLNYQRLVRILKS